MKIQFTLFCPCQGVAAGGNERREQSSSSRCHLLAGRVAECGEPEGWSDGHSAGSASQLAPIRTGTVGSRRPGRAIAAAALNGICVMMPS